MTPCRSEMTVRTSSADVPQSSRQAAGVTAAGEWLPVGIDTRVYPLSQLSQQFM